MSSLVFYNFWKILPKNSSFLRREFTRLFVVFHHSSSLLRYNLSLSQGTRFFIYISSIITGGRIIDLLPPFFDESFVSNRVIDLTRVIFKGGGKSHVLPCFLLYDRKVRNIENSALEEEEDFFFFCFIDWERRKRKESFRRKESLYSRSSERIYIFRNVRIGSLFDSFCLEFFLR